MRELTPRARELLAEYRRAHAPMPLSRERAARALARRLARGELGTADAEAEAPELPLPRTAPRTLTSVATVAAALLGVGLATFAGAGLRSPAASREHADTHATQLVAARRPSTSAATSPSIATGAAPQAGAPHDADPETAPRTRNRAANRTARVHGRERAANVELAVAAAAPAAAAPAAAPAEAEATAAFATESAASAARSASDAAPELGAHARAPTPIDEEIGLLRAAYDALHAGDPQRALVQLAEHRWRFPKGQLADARDVARMLALCANGDAASARTEAKRFLALRPHSPYAERVRGICGSNAASD